MGMTYTKEQLQVIETRDKNLLVSAAAGSGKTAVLVERILSRLMDERHPIDIDHMLIVTFTNAAAAEMRERIGMAIEKALRERPDDQHLIRQQTLLHNAQITTIHSFCLFVIRNYFHRMDLEPDFRVGEEGELQLLKQDVLSELLEDDYGKCDPLFLRLSETLSTGKSDTQLGEEILTLYQFAMSDPWPEEWLERCLLPYRKMSLEEFEDQPMGKALLSYLKAVTTQWKRMEEMALEICQEADGPGAYADVLERELAMISAVSECGSYEGYANAIGNVTFERLPSVRNFQGDKGKKEFVMELRNDVKASYKKLVGQFFFLPPQEMLDLMAENEPLVRMLVQVTKEFKERFDAKKREKNMLDFNDLEHFALRLLLDPKTHEPTEVAAELRGQFEEIMTDEYQDSNYVQEALLSAIAREDNRFMVGDVKQSIYRFRMARPELFMEKYEAYGTGSGKDLRIDLHKNFRSRPEVLSTVNDVFFRIMAKDLGNVEYDEANALYQGMEFPPGPAGMFETEFLVADADSFAETGEGQEAEFAMLSQKIQEMMGAQLVTDAESGQLRPMRYRDVAILLRNMSGQGPLLLEVLKAHGIPAVASTGTGYFSAVEVQTVLHLLRLIDNPRQDIPLAAVLASPIVGLSPDELAVLRTHGKELPFFQCLPSYLETGPEGPLKEKLSAFWQMLAEFRELALDTPIHELLYQVMERTGYLDYAYAMPGGRVRRANLEMLLERAASYEKTSYHGLFSFIRYMDQLQKYEVDYGEAGEMGVEDVVRVMTIHKSKGLEFPVVFVAGLGKQMNRKDIQRRMVLHPQLGIGLDVTDLGKRVRIPSLSRQILARQAQMEMVGEELRVLYVALTRAREKLVLTGTLKKAEEKMAGFARWRMDASGHLGFLERLSANSYLDWLLPAFLDSGRRVRLVTSEDLSSWQGIEGMEAAMDKELLLAMEERHDPGWDAEIEGRLSFVYPYENEREIKANLSVSELKHRAMDQLREEEPDMAYLFEEPEIVPYVPAFLRGLEEEPKGNVAALRGTAMHRVLECLDFTRDASTLESQVEQMRMDGRLEQALYELVSLPDLAAFLGTPLAGRMREAAKRGKLYREKPFVMGKPASEVTEGTDSQAMVLVQGIMDAFFEEDGKLVLVDYKTDAVRDARELCKRYQAQMDLYQEALARVQEKEVKEKVLYSFRLKEAIVL